MEDSDIHKGIKRSKTTRGPNKNNIEISVQKVNERKARHPPGKPEMGKCLRP